MYNSKKWRWIFLGAVLLILAGFTVWRTADAYSKCMGVYVISETDAAAYSQYEYRDFGPELAYHGKPAAVDQSNAIIYISQNITQETHWRELSGTLELMLSGYQMYFVDNAALQDLNQSARNSQPLRLLIVSQENTYMEYNVILTTLPVLRINGVPSFLDDEDRQVYAGDFCLWNGQDSAEDGYTVQSCMAQWNTRGHSTAAFDKKSLKLSLKTANGNNRDLNLCGMGADDDWLLNAMVTDDTKMREKILMHLWNEMCDTVNYNYKMSTGEYVEVIKDGKYCGLYLLQRRIDGKYLDLDSSEVLLKNGVIASACSYDVKTVLEAADKVLDKTDCSLLALDNWIDTSLFVEFSYGLDNQGHENNNAYQVVTFQNGEPKIKLILWDTDMSFGIHLNEDWKFVYYPHTAETICYPRSEFPALVELYPDLSKMMANRWFALRQNSLHIDRIVSLMDQMSARIGSSGALQRECYTNGFIHGGVDTQESLRDYVVRRLNWMDNYYSQFSAGS